MKLKCVLQTFLTVIPNITESDKNALETPFSENGSLARSNTMHVNINTPVIMQR